MVKFLDVVPPGPGGDLKTNWLPTEQLWLNHHTPGPCFEPAFEAWRDALEEIQAVTAGMQILGGTSDEEFARFATAREAIESFDPTALSTC